ncbi:hypothetical protein [Volucribacter amazonae]|nr:hypothetical protein [Volucribacter amazonae]
MLKLTFITLKWLLIIALLLAAVIWGYIQFYPTFGVVPDAESLVKIQ